MIKLNIGCGNDVRLGYLNLDCRPLEGVDFVCDLMDICEHYEPESVDEILANDIIEHFGHREVDRILKQLFVILKNGGILHIRVPDVDVHVNRYKQGHYTADELSYWLFGAQDYDTNFHKMCFNYESLREHLQKAGFAHISKKIDCGINFAIEAFK